MCGCSISHLLTLLLYLGAWLNIFGFIQMWLALLMITYVSAICQCCERGELAAKPGRCDTYSLVPPTHNGCTNFLGDPGCKSPLLCVNERCVANVTCGGTVCIPPHECVGGRCLSGPTPIQCATTVPCPPGEICTRGTCLPIPYLETVRGDCLTSEECPMGWHCSITDVPFKLCTNTNGPHTNCDAQHLCQPGQTCLALPTPVPPLVDGICANSAGLGVLYHCSTVADCPQDLTCSDTGYCSCMSNDQCPFSGECLLRHPLVQVGGICAA